jgi:hypothetical protein
VAVALDEADDAADGVDGGVWDDAVAEVEDVAGAAGGEGEDFEDAGFEDVVVPKGVEHKAFAAGEVKLMLIEPKGVVYTGDAGGDMTAENHVWIEGVVKGQ